jgi:hypothetical protein
VRGIFQERGSGPTLWNSPECAVEHFRLQIQTSRFPKSSLATCPVCQMQKICNGEGQRKEVYCTAWAAEGREKVAFQPIFPSRHLASGLNRGKNWVQEERYAELLNGHRHICVSVVRGGTGNLAAHCRRIGQVRTFYSKSDWCLAGSLSCWGSVILFLGAISSVCPCDAIHQSFLPEFQGDCKEQRQIQIGDRDVLSLICGPKEEVSAF